MTTFKNIPSIDLADFTKGDDKLKNAFVKQIGEAYENIGFVAIKNHGLSAELSALLYAQVQQFFELTVAQKEQYEIEGLGGQRGYVSFGKENIA